MDRDGFSLLAMGFTRNPRLEGLFVKITELLPAGGLYLRDQSSLKG
jgi:hypothetical protein